MIIPVLEESRVLPHLLASLATLRETATADLLEVIAVDGGSTDDSVALLEQAGIRCLHGACGRAAQMNLGAQAARGEVLLFLHADTKLPAGALAEIERAVAAGACGGWFRVQLDSQRTLHRCVGRMISWRSQLTGGGSGDQAIFCTRAAFDALGGFRLLPLFEDLDFCRRLRRHGRVVALDLAVTTSARRWEMRGTWRTIAWMSLLRLLYHCGVDPRRLSRRYPSVR